MNKNKSLYTNSLYFILYRVINVIYPLITITYVSRVLKPSGVGEVSLVQTIVTFLVAVALLGIPNYGVREISKITNQEHLNKTFSELFVTNFLSTLIITTIYYGIINLVHLPIDKTLYNIEGIILLFNVFNVDWFYQGMEEFKYITIRSVVVKIISMIAIFLFVKDINDIRTYATIFSLAYVGNYLFNMIHLKKYVHFTFKGLNLTLHLKYILILAVTYISNEIYVTVDSLMLGTMSTLSYVGYYSNSMKLIKILINVFTAIGTAILPRLSYLKSTKNYEKFNIIISKALMILLWITIPSCIGLILISKDLVVILFGKDFLPSYGILNVLSLLVIFRTLSNLFLQILLCINKDNKISAIYFSGMILNICLNAVLIKNYNAIGASIASVISEFLIMISLLWQTRHKINIKVSSKYILNLLASNCIVLLIGTIINQIQMNILIKLILTIIICTGSYCIINLLMKNEVINLLIEKLKIKKGNK